MADLVKDLHLQIQRGNVGPVANVNDPLYAKCQVAFVPTFMMRREGSTTCGHVVHRKYCTVLAVLERQHT